MKKILFVLPHMLAGGVETALLAMLDELDREKYEIDVLLVEKEGEFLCRLPTNVRVDRLPLSSRLANEILHGKNTSEFVRNAIKNFEFLLALQIVFRKVILKDPLAKYYVPFSKIKPLTDTYDIAVCYHAHCPFILKYVAEKIICKKRVLWIHNDFKSTNFDITLYKKQLDKYDRFYCVSKDLQDELLNLVPELTDRVRIFYNIIPMSQIKTKAGLFAPKEYENTQVPIILSIGRLNHQKGFDIAVEVSKMLVDRGVEHRWFVIGDGEDRRQIENLITDYGVKDNFHLLGVHNNPYPYLKNTTIYVQPSRHEGYGIAMAEARAFELPIICTDFAGAREQIRNGETGIVVKCDKNELCDAIQKLLANPQLQDEFRMNLKQQNENTGANCGLEDFLALLECKED